MLPRARLFVLVLALPGCLVPESEEASAALDLPAGVRPELVEPARQNLKRLSKQLDRQTLASYRLSARAEDAFLEALVDEYRTQPAMLDRQLETLSKTAFAAPAGPGKQPAASGIWGELTNDTLVALTENQAKLFQHHQADARGASGGVLPFSVCETRFLIEVSSGRRTAPWASCRRITDVDTYARDYASFVSSCAQAELEELYAYIGMPTLSPRWLESGLADRAAASSADRFADRQALNRQLALRALYYEASMRDLEDPMAHGMLIRDQNADGVGDWVPLEAARLIGGAQVVLPIGTRLPVPQKLTGQLTTALDTDGTTAPPGTTVEIEAGETVLLKTRLVRPAESLQPIVAGTEVDVRDARLRLGDGTPVQMRPDSVATVRLDRAFSLSVSGAVREVFADASPIGSGGDVVHELHVLIPLAQRQTVVREVVGTVTAADLVHQTAVAPGVNRELLARPDLGLLAVFPDVTAAKRRLMTLLARNQDHYQTFVSLRPQDSLVWGGGPGSRPGWATPLVTASALLEKARLLSFGSPSVNGTRRFIQVVRVPYCDLVTAASAGVDTLSLAGSRSAPPTTTLQAGTVDLGRMWLDDASLATDHFAEMPMSKLGAVSAQQTDALIAFDFERSAPTYGASCQ